MRVQLTILACCYSVAGCWAPSPDFKIASADSLREVKGSLSVTLSDGKSRYEATLVSGRVEGQKVSPGPAYELVRDETKQKRYSVPDKSGFRLRPPFALSPDGKFLASAIVSQKGDPYAPAESLGIFEYPTGNLRGVFKSADSRVLESIAWSPTSDMIVVLTATSKSGKSPGDILSAVTGHPVSYVSFYLQIVSLNGKSLAETKLASDLQSGFGHVSWR